MKDIFDISGPKHLKGIVDWKNAVHRRSVTASLVRGVSVLETDRQRKMTISKNPINYAPPWWESFNFHLHKYLPEDDGCIFCAIYEYINYGKCPASDDSNVPRYVIAFRGTHFGPAKAAFRGTHLRPAKAVKDTVKDLILDLNCFFNRLQESHRSQLAMRYVEDFVNSNGSSNVWLAGHSLGSAIALIVGRNMMLKNNCSLEAYLFNPPYASLHIEKLFTSMNEDVKQLVRFARGKFKKFLTIVAEARINPQTQEQKAETFSLLSGWTPHLFVNPGDVICSEYIEYFKDRRETAPEMKTPSLAKSCTTKDLFKHVMGWGDLKDAMHLLPSAVLIVNQSRPHEKNPANYNFINIFRNAHGLCQWWDREVRCQSTLYVYPQRRPTTKDPQ